MSNKYMKELTYFKSAVSCFVIEGNIYDIYPLQEGDRIRYVSLLQLLSSVFDAQNSGANTLLYYDFVTGEFKDPLYMEQTSAIVRKAEEAVDTDKKNVEAINARSKHDFHSMNKLTQGSEIIAKAITQPTEDRPIVLVCDNVSRISANPSNLSPDESYVYSNLQTAITNAYKENKLILLTEKSNDLPSWILNLQTVRYITIPSPDRETREAYIKAHIHLKSGESEKEVERLVDFTNELSLLQINQILSLYNTTNDKLSLNQTMLLYRFGVKENPWEAIKAKLNALDIDAELGKRIKGQKLAVNTIATALRKICNGMHNLSSSSSNTQPALRALFAGPTGVGKTETIKALAALLFADENAVVRFDMGEYSGEGSEQRLIGSPPGYIGYGQPGKLVEALKKNPSSIILFDEIEKAHDTLFTSLLGLLDDGRITSGSGETVYASESLIFFTSNIGISKIIKDPVTCEKKKVMNANPHMPHEELETTVMSEIRSFFKDEFIGRLSDIIVFDYLTPEIAYEIAKMKIDKIVENLKERGVDLFINNDVYNYFKNACESEETRSYGGRSIKSLIEKKLEAPITDFIVSNPDAKSMEALLENGQITIRRRDNV